MNILIVIPARGGSKGIPRKNLRNLNGKPLIYYVIRTALTSTYTPDVYVTSEDDEILAISQKIGAKILKRDASKSKDETTLDPVIYDAYTKAIEAEKKDYKLIVTIQPTSPMLKVTSIDAAIYKMLNDQTIDSILSAKDDTHLTWKREHGKYIKNYKKRVNRQYLTPVFKETGGFLITRDSIISENNRIAQNTELYMLNNGEDIDIDNYEDWQLCEYYLKRKKILFVVSGFKEIGLGHVYNTLLIANDILNHNVAFFVDNKSQMAFDIIKSNNYQVHIQKNENIIDDIKQYAPDVIINDRLDTDAIYVLALKSLGIKVINIEDVGTGAKEADLVINAIYPEKEILPKHYFGHNYFVLRDEFILTEKKIISNKVKTVLLTFGGVDPNNFTLKVLKSIYRYCMKNSISVSIVGGYGYANYKELAGYCNIDIYQNATNISEHMKEADIIFTSAGRTIYEVASLNVPAIVLAQNKRELSHFFASEEYGFTNLGLGNNISSEEILSVFSNLVDNYEARKRISALMAKVDLRLGRDRTLKLIKEAVENA